jgi:hypothetical protein
LFFLQIAATYSFVISYRRRNLIDAGYGITASNKAKSLKRKKSAAELKISQMMNRVLCELMSPESWLIRDRINFPIVGSRRLLVVKN